MELNVTITNNENIRELSENDIEQVQEIMKALITVGGLNRVKGGSTTINFDSDGNFKNIQLSYFPWTQKKKVKKS